MSQKDKESKEVKHTTVKYSSLPLLDNRSFATHTIAGTINDATFKEFREFLKKVYEQNLDIDKEEKEYKEKEAFKKIHDPEAKPEFRSTKVKVERINLIVDSHGGSCSSMTNIVALMNASSIPIDTYCFGTAMSAGFMIFIHGKRRYIDQTVSMLTHSLSAVAWDNAPNIKRISEHYSKMNETYQKMIAAKTGLTMEWLKENEERDITFTYNEVLKHKIADILVTN